MHTLVNGGRMRMRQRTPLPSLPRELQPWVTWSAETANVLGLKYCNQEMEGLEQQTK